MIELLLVELKLETRNFKLRLAHCTALPFEPHRRCIERPKDIERSSAALRSAMPLS